MFFGTTKKSIALCAVPPGVVTDTFPDVAPTGTCTPRLVADAVLTAATLAVVRSNTLSFVGTGSNSVPVIVKASPAAPAFGVKPVIVGAPLVAVTSKLVALVAEPPGAVTAMLPVVAPGGTVTVSSNADASVTVAAVPLKVTVFKPGVAPKPVP